MPSVQPRPLGHEEAGQLDGGGVDQLGLRLAKAQSPIEETQWIAAGYRQLAELVEAAPVAVLGDCPRRAAIGPQRQDPPAGPEQRRLVDGLEKQLGEPVEVLDSDLLLQRVAHLGRNGVTRRTSP